MRDGTGCLSAMNATVGKAARDLKMTADQGNADAQRNYRVFLEGDEGVSRDLAELVNTR